MVNYTINIPLRNSNPHGGGISDSNTIPTHPELNRIALKQQIDAEYLLWCVLRHTVAERGLSSHFDREQVYCIALAHGLSWTRRHFNRVIIQGDGTFWKAGKSRIFLTSFKRVYNALADKEAAAVPSPRFVLIKTHKSALDRRAEFYWSWFISRDEQTIARATISDLFGLSPDQQRDYESSLGKRLIIKSNYCHIDADLYANDLKNIPGHAFNFIQEKFQDNKVEYINVLAYQLPNTYNAREHKHGESPQVFAPNRALRASRTLYRLESACSYIERCFYNFYDEWEKHMNQNAYIRTYFQGKKTIWRSGHFF
jgi:hypothetical protein